MRMTVWCALLMVPLVPVASGSESGTARDLFNGNDLVGWTFVSLKPGGVADVARVTPAHVLTVTGKPTGYLVAPGGPYANYRLHAEYRWLAPKGNSGFLLLLHGGPRNGKPWPSCLQIQNRDQHTGELIPMGGLTFDGCPPDGKVLPTRFPPKEKPIGDWNECDVTCEGDTVSATVNGVLQNTAHHVSSTSGAIAIQLEGYPVEIRTLRLLPLARPAP